MKINILGTEYTIETHKISEDKLLLNNRWSGYCGEESKVIVVADMGEKEYFQDMDEKEQNVYRNEILRHEIIHAFFKESGLSGNSNHFEEAWAKNEEMVDWIAIQFPKILEVFKQCECL